MNAEPQKEHEWLQKLVGEWTTEAECSMGPDQPPSTFKGTETVRTLGGLWVLCEGNGDTGQSIMTLGYDPARMRFVGTFVASCMTHLWIYDDGELSADGTTLTLSAEGPGFTNPEQMAKYHDVIEFKSDDHRVLTSRILGDDGQWTQFMTAHYRRK